jgi:hypothetical protein
VRYIMGLLGFIVLIILVIVLFARMGNRSDSNLDLASAPRLDEAASSDASFTYIEHGPIVAEEEHHEIRITVSRISRRIEIVRGYQDTVVAQANFDNNEQAFGQFLSAIDRGGYNLENKTDFESEVGLCPREKRYIFQSNQFSESFRRWTSSCRNIKGSFGGSLSTVRALFRDQIPDYRKFITETRKATDLDL